MSDLNTTVGKLELDSPVMTASGILDETAESMLALFEYGAAAVVTKSCGPEPRDGHNNPVITEVKCGMLNCMGLPNPGIDHMVEEVGELKDLMARHDVSGKIVMSIFGGDADEFAAVAEKATGDAIELNLSCPNVKGHGSEIGGDPETIREVVKAVKQTTSLPVWAKLTPNTNDIASLAEAAADAGADAIVAINTLKAIAIDTEVMAPILSNTYGGYSGPGIKPVGLRCVHELFKAVGDTTPIVGVGGIMSGSDVVEYLACGASAVQVGTAMYYEGEGAYKEILAGLEKWMDEHGYDSVQDMVGKVHES